MAYPIENFVEYSLPFDMDAKLRVQLARNGSIIQKDIELVSIRIFAADKSESSGTKFSVRYYDTFKDAYTAKELVTGFVCFLDTIETPHINDYVCYCKKCNDIRRAQMGVLDSTEKDDLPF